MDNFLRYELLRGKGNSPRSIYLAGKADGLDPITLIRMIRSVCSLSLTEAKKVATAGVDFDQPQSLHEGALVNWDVSTSDGKRLIREGRVLQVGADDIEVEVTGEYDLLSGEDLPCPAGMESLTIPRLYFQVPLTQRLEEAIQFWDSLERHVQI